MPLEYMGCIPVGIIQKLLVRVCEEVDANGEIEEWMKCIFERNR